MISSAGTERMHQARIDERCRRLAEWWDKLPATEVELELSRRSSCCRDLLGGTYTGESAKSTRRYVISCTCCGRVVSDQRAQPPRAIERSPLGDSDDVPAIEIQPAGTGPDDSEVPF